MKYNKKVLILLIINIALSFVLFSSVLSGDYILDDHSVIEKREELRSIKEWPGLFLTSWHPSSPWAGTYRPLTLISYSFNFFFFDSPTGLHFTNVLLHAINVTLIFYLVSLIISERAGLFASAIFMFLPIHVEPVAAIVGRVYLLGTMFGLVSLILFFKKRYFWSSVSLILALFSSEAAISLYAVIAIFLLMENRNLWKSFKHGSVFLSFLPIYFFLRYLALGEYAFGKATFIDKVIGPLAFVSTKERILTALSHTYIYIKKTFYPLNLTPDYYFNQVPTVSNLFASSEALSGLIFLIVIVLIFILGNRNFKMASVLLLIPYLFISNLFFVASGTMAERFWYLPSIGIAIILSLIFCKIIDIRPKIKKSLYATMVIVLSWYSFLIIKQNKVWLNDRSLYIYASNTSPNSAWSQTNLAAVYFKDGKYDLARMQIEKSLAIYDSSPSSLNILGKLEWEEGKYENAEKAFRSAIEFDLHGRNRRSLYRILALLNLDSKQNRKALDYMTEALKWPVPAERENIKKGDEILLRIIEKKARSQRLTEVEEDSLDAFFKVYKRF